MPEPFPPDPTDETPPRGFPGARSAPRLEAAGFLGLAGVGGLLVGFWVLDLGEAVRGSGFTGASVILTVIFALVLGLPAVGACAVGRRLRRERTQDPALRPAQMRVAMVGMAVVGLLLALWKGLPGAP